MRVSSPIAGAERGKKPGAPPLPGEAGVRRYHDPAFNAIAVKLLPGEHYVTQSPAEMIVTVLGSCVCACIRDPAAGVGGMNHFMLPESTDGEWGHVPASLRYGNFAMEQLINDIIKLGGRRSNLEIKVFGGANVLARGGMMIGRQNSQFILSYLAAERLPVAASHLYGSHPRRVHYFPASGRVAMLELIRQGDPETIPDEKSYRETLKRNPASGSVEYFS